MKKIFKYIPILFISFFSLLACDTRVDIDSGGIENLNNNICNIICTKAEHGKISCNKVAHYGDKVKIHIEPEQYYTLNTITINDIAIDKEKLEFIAMKEKYIITASFIQNEFPPDYIPFHCYLVSATRDDITIKYTWESDLISYHYAWLVEEESQHYCNIKTEEADSKSRTVTFYHYYDETNFRLVIHYSIKNNNKTHIFKSNLIQIY